MNRLNSIWSSKYIFLKWKFSNLAPRSWSPMPRPRYLLSTDNPNDAMNLSTPYCSKRSKSRYRQQATSHKHLIAGVLHCTKSNRKQITFSISFNLRYGLHRKVWIKIQNLRQRTLVRKTSRFCTRWMSSWCQQCHLTHCDSKPMASSVLESLCNHKWIRPKPFDQRMRLLNWIQCFELQIEIIF